MSFFYFSFIIYHMSPMSRSHLLLLIGGNPNQNSVSSSTTYLFIYIHIYLKFFISYLNNLSKTFGSFWYILTRDHQKISSYFRGKVCQENIPKALTQARMHLCFIVHHGRLRPTMCNLDDISADQTKNFFQSLLVFVSLWSHTGCGLCGWRFIIPRWCSS